MHENRGTYPWHPKSENRLIKFTKGKDMTETTDYYAVLKIPRSASEAEVRAAYKREVRIWRKQATTSSQDSLKDEAEKRLASLAEAYRTLSDAQRRSAYNRQIITAPTTPASYPISVEVLAQDWIEQAEDYLAKADYQMAARAAREATTNQGDSARSWFILSRANAGLQQLNDAIYEARRAIELEAGNPLYHFNLGTIYEELERWNEALNAYEQALQLDPSEPLYQLAIGAVWLQNGQITKAIPIIKRIYSASPNDETACYYYAQGLIAMAESVPHDKSKDGYAVTTPEEIQRMREHLDRASTIRCLDQETKRTIRNIQDYLESMETHTFNIPLGASSLAFGLMSVADGGCIAIAVMSLVIGAIFGAPLLVLLWGFSLLTSGSILGGLFILLCSGGLGYAWYKAMWVPKWKVNARLRNHRIRYLS